MQTVQEQERELAALEHERTVLSDDLARTRPPQLCRHHQKPIIAHSHPIVHTPGRCCYCGSPVAPPPDKGLIVAQYVLSIIMAVVWGLVGVLLGGLFVWALTGLLNIAWMGLGFPSVFSADYLDLFPSQTLMFRIGAWCGCLLGLFLGFILGSDIPKRRKDGELAIFG